MNKEAKEKEIAELAEKLERWRMEARGYVESLNEGFGMWYAKKIEDGYRKCK